MIALFTIVAGLACCWYGVSKLEEIEQPTASDRATPIAGFIAGVVISVFGLIWLLDTFR